MTRNSLIEQTTKYARMHAQKIWHYLEDEAVIEVAVNPDGTVWYERSVDPHMVKGEEVFERDAIIELAKQLAGTSGATIGKDNLAVSTMIEVNNAPMRAQAIIPPATGGIGSLTIRKFPKSRIVSQDIQIIGSNIYKQVKDINPDIFHEGRNFQEIAEFIVDNRLTCIVSGGTGSGKTTLLKTILDHVDKQERIITIEDVPEIILDIPNFVNLRAERESESRSPHKLLESVMRMRPDRFLIGELRGAETLAFFEAVNTGHPGSFTTVHANSSDLALNRLIFMCLRAAPNMSQRLIIRNIIDSIDVIIHVVRDGKRRGPSEFFFPKLNENELLNKFS